MRNQLLEDRRFKIRQEVDPAFRLGFDKQRLLVVNIFGTFSDHHLAQDFSDDLVRAEKITREGQPAFAPRSVDKVTQRRFRSFPSLNLFMNAIQSLQPASK